MRAFRAILCASVFAVCAPAQDRWQELTDAGLRAFEKQRLAEAERHFKAALQQADQPGLQDPRLPESCDNLAEVYRLQNKPKEAEKLLRRALAIREARLGPNHLQVALNLDAVAGVLSAQKKHNQADPLYVRARQIRERAVARHPETYVDGEAKPVRRQP